MRRIAQWSALMLMILTVTACASQQERYLKPNVNQANQDAVAKRLGPPSHSQELTTGETIWAYESCNGDCKAAILTFDRAKVLREWKEQKR